MRQLLVKMGTAGWVATESTEFPGGEIQARLPEGSKITGTVEVLARLQDARSLIHLALLTELIERHKGIKQRLIVPYFPYARQDRVMQPNEAFSLKVVARIVNALGFDEVVVCDPHSDVTPALVENVRVIPQVVLAASHDGLRGLLKDRAHVIVAPDAGAAKKALAVARHFGLPLLTASKVRDTATGAITRTEVQDGLEGRDALIVDDICDGGRTFIELAKVLRAQGAARVYLYVTHGIFSQGLGVFEGLIDGIFTTDAFVSPYLGDDRPVPLHVSNLDFNAKGIAA